MFIQIIQGKARDKAGLERQNDAWERDIQSGAKGYLGMTGGVADDGTAVFLARFDSEAAAQANSARPEQGEWWNDTAKCFDGEVTFQNCTDVDLEVIGNPDDAGFVQIMQGTASNKSRVRELEQQLLPKLKQMRPDILGSVRAWDGDRWMQAVYFTSEADARNGETAMGEDAPPELEEFFELSGEPTFIDLKDPWLKTP